MNKKRFLGAIGVKFYRIKGGSGLLLKVEHSPGVVMCTVNEGYKVRCRCDPRRRYLLVRNVTLFDRIVTVKYRWSELEDVTAENRIF